MTEPGKNRSPLELEVMELLELRENLKKGTAQLRVEFDECDKKLRALHNKAFDMDPRDTIRRLKFDKKHLERAVDGFSTAIERIRKHEPFASAKPGTAWDFDGIEALEGRRDSLGYAQQRFDSAISIMEWFRKERYEDE